MEWIERLNSAINYIELDDTFCHLHSHIAGE